jgi:hypothetical protein
MGERTNWIELGWERTWAESDSGLAAGGRWNWRTNDATGLTSAGEEAPPGFEPGVADLQSATGRAKGAAVQRTSGEATLRLTVPLTGAGESDCEPVRVEDPDLARVVRAWGSLPTHLRAAVVALIASAGATTSAASGKPDRRRKTF